MDGRTAGWLTPCVQHHLTTSHTQLSWARIFCVIFIFHTTRVAQNVKLTWLFSPSQDISLLPYPCRPKCESNMGTTCSAGLPQPFRSTHGSTYRLKWGHYTMQTVCLHKENTILRHQSMQSKIFLWWTDYTWVRYFSNNDFWSITASHVSLL